MIPPPWTRLCAIDAERLQADSEQAFFDVLHNAVAPKPQEAQANRDYDKLLSGLEQAAPWSAGSLTDPRQRVGHG